MTMGLALTPSPAMRVCTVSAMSATYLQLDGRPCLQQHLQCCCAVHTRCQHERTAAIGRPRVRDCTLLEQLTNGLDRHLHGTHTHTYTHTCSVLSIPTIEMTAGPQPAAQALVCISCACVCVCLYAYLSGVSCACQQHCVEHLASLTRHCHINGRLTTCVLDQARTSAGLQPQGTAYDSLPTQHNTTAQAWLHLAFSNSNGCPDTQPRQKAAKTALQATLSSAHWSASLRHATLQRTCAHLCDVVGTHGVSVNG